LFVLLKMARRELQGKVAIITGSGQGLGKAFANQLLMRGAKVCLSDVKTETGLKTMAELKDTYGSQNVHFISCDVRSTKQLEELYFGCERHFNEKVKIFCNNAGVNQTPGWQTCIEIDALGVVAGSEVALSQMSLKEGGEGGLIVNTASLAGIVHGINRDMSSYFVAKHGVVALTRSLGRERGTGVDHMAVCPAFAETEILNGVGLSRAQLEKREGVMTPEYVAECFLKLVETGKNGDVMIVRKNTPAFVYPDLSLPLVDIFSKGAKISDKVLGGKLFREVHLKRILGLAALLLFLVCHTLLCCLTGIVKEI